ncbi:MAG TPA: HEAT repeat domain-containing protein [Lacipirellulaceae bacterium]|jgi:HEAT repeat protein
MFRLGFLRCWLALGCLATLTGCHSFLGYRGWPFPEIDNTTFVTPTMRKDTIRQYAARADGTDSSDQRAASDQLARQIQIEPDPLVRETIIRAIAEFHTPLAGQVLEAGLNDDNQLVRVACCQTLGKRADEHSVTALASALRQDKQMDVRLAAAEALGKIKSPSAVSALAVALDDHDPAMQFAGMQSMKSVTGKDYGGDVQAWRQVAAGGNPAPPPAPSIASRLKEYSPF